uniref:Uncharacterized protein n=1 Tax=Rhizophora mucronata TaxID=61149 RepID=A0A2P2LYU3_RHIMU
MAQDGEKKKVLNAFIISGKKKKILYYMPLVLLPAVNILSHFWLWCSSLAPVGFLFFFFWWGAFAGFSFAFHFVGNSIALSLSVR